MENEMETVMIQGSIIWGFWNFGGRAVGPTAGYSLLS